MDDEARRKLQKPNIGDIAKEENRNLVKELVQNHFGVIVKDNEIEMMDSYDDVNIKITGYLLSHSGSDGAADAVSNDYSEFVIKFHNGVETENIGIVDAQIEAINHLSSAGVSTCKNIPVVKNADVDTETKGNKYIAFVKLISFMDGKDQEIVHAMRCMKYIPGELFERDNNKPLQLYRLGEYLSKMDKSLIGFKHEATKRTHIWDLRNFLAIHKFVESIDDDHIRSLVKESMQLFEEINEKCKDIRMSVIHNDANDHNIITDSYGISNELSIIDFGDMVHSWLVNEIAIAAAYVIIGGWAGRLSEKELGEIESKDYAPSWIDNCTELIRGYETGIKLEKNEREIIYTLIQCRIATSVTLGAYSISKDPTNEYLKLHSKPGRIALRSMANPRMKELFHERLKSKLDGIGQSNVDSNSNGESKRIKE